MKKKELAKRLTRLEWDASKKVVDLEARIDTEKWHREITDRHLIQLQSEVNDLRDRVSTVEDMVDRLLLQRGFEVVK